MAIIWPAELPQDVLTGYRERLPAMALRSSMSVGPAKVRRRFTAAPRNFAVTLRLRRDPVVPANDQVLRFRSFWESDTAGGTLSFDWTDPLDGSVLSFRFAYGDGEAPELQHAGGNDYEVELKLEVLP